MNKKRIFDAVRIIIGRGFSQVEAGMIDSAIDDALADGGSQRFCATTHRLGKLSERFESGGRGAGTVSSGQGDPGGVSYGIYQLASRTGTADAFVRNEGARWIGDFDSAKPGSGAFSAAWKVIAARESDAFAEAQHGFIRRTHYQPVVASALSKTGLDLDSRHPAVRDATWSVSVQHGRAARVLAAAIEKADASLSRGDAAYDLALIKAIYAERSAYVLRVAARASGASRRTLESITRNRYPAELAAALAMFGASPALI